MCRTLARAAALFLVSVTPLASQNSGSIQVTDGGAPSSGVDIFVLVNQGKQRVGVTGSQGALPFDPALLAGKLKGETIKRTCSDRTELILVVDGEQYQCEEKDENGERCDCEPVGVWLFSNGQISLELGQSGAASLAKNPIAIGAIGAGAVTVIAVTAGGGDSSTSTSSTFTTPSSSGTTTSSGGTSSGGSTGTGTETSASSFNGTYPGNFVLVRDECNFFNPSFNGSVIVNANDNGSITVQIVESITRTSNGTITVSSAGNATAATSGSGSIGNQAINFETMLTFRGGRLDVQETIRKPAGNNCAAIYQASNLQPQ